MPLSPRSRRIASSWRLARALALTAAVVFGPGANAQAGSAPGAAGAEAAARAYLDAVATADWVAAGRAIDPDELDAIGTMLSFIAEIDTTGEASETLGLTGEADGVQAFAQFMDRIHGMAPELEAGYRSMRYEILGTVAEGDSLVHVVNRTYTTVYDVDVQSVAVISARWLGDRWGVRLDEKMRGMTQAFAQMGEAFGEAAEAWENDGWEDEAWEDEADGDGEGDAEDGAEG